jgi:hypothetical protein
MMRTLLLATCVAGVFAFSATPAAADPLTVDGSWHTFQFGGVGSSFNTTYTFTLPGLGVLTVTDAFLSGDRFDVTDFGSSLGATSIPTSLDEQVNDDYDAAAADPRWSTGTYVLGPGSYSINGTVLVSPFGGGGAAMRVDTLRIQDQQVPEPALALLAGGALAACGLRRRLRNRRAAA